MSLSDIAQHAAMGLLVGDVEIQTDASMEPGLMVCLVRDADGALRPAQEGDRRAHGVRVHPSDVPAIEQVVEEQRVRRLGAERAAEYTASLRKAPPRA